MASTVAPKLEPWTKSVTAYRAKLAAQGKEIYKDPPVLPPKALTVMPTKQPLPQRNAHREYVFADHPEFTPNLSPKEILQNGAFGGTYFRPIQSAVTGESYSNVYKEFPEDWFSGLTISTHIVSNVYRVQVNKYGVKCGGSLGMWESSGWISVLDPYGWFQWYCRFFLGRRTDDDERQIQRWSAGMGPKGRWRLQLINKVNAANTTFDNRKISPVIRQTCMHWGYELNERDVTMHKQAKLALKMKEESSTSEGEPSRKRKASTVKASTAKRRASIKKEPESESESDSSDSSDSSSSSSSDSRTSSGSGSTSSSSSDSDSD